jgi:hypothetical protein
MKTILVSFLALVAAGGAFAGERVVATDRTARYSEGKCDRTRKTRNAGTPGAYYHSNFFHNAIMLINDTPDYMTFFVYSGDVCGPNDINGFIRRGAHVYPTLVPPYGRSFTDERAHHYWVGSKRGKWAIDLTRNCVTPLDW